MRASVCKILDYSKLKYEQARKAKAAHAEPGQVRGFRDVAQGGVVITKLRRVTCCASSRRSTRQDHHHVRGREMAHLCT